ncbi:uncharacterized protein [Haliotis asinina]|uniref:uncharacterized protein n=1 Tax=Haliotis asinina TaxID=109174 RepID=UPI003532291D
MPRDWGTAPSVQRVLVCLCLCALPLTCLALPLPESQGNPQLDKQMQLMRILFRLGERGHSSPYIYSHALLSPSSGQRRKRFGIAGLDNVNFITSTLDQLRAREKPPILRPRVTMEQLQEMMNAGR